MLSEAKHLSDISVYESLQIWSEILRFAQNDITRWFWIFHSMIGTLDPKVPPGPLDQKWRNHQDHSRLVNPNNRENLRS